MLVKQSIIIDKMICKVVALENGPDSEVNFYTDFC
jgi:hypothetical protein